VQGCGGAEVGSALEVDGARGLELVDRVHRSQPDGHHQPLARIGGAYAGDVERDGLMGADRRQVFAVSPAGREGLAFLNDDGAKRVSGDLDHGVDVAAQGGVLAVGVDVADRGRLGQINWRHGVAFDPNNAVHNQIHLPAAQNAQPAIDEVRGVVVDLDRRVAEDVGDIELDGCHRHRAEGLLRLPLTRGRSAEEVPGHVVDAEPLVEQDEPRAGVMRGGGRVLLRPLDLGGLAVDGGDLDDLTVEQDEIAGSEAREVLGGDRGRLLIDRGAQGGLDGRSFVVVPDGESKGGDRFRVGEVLEPDSGKDEHPGIRRHTENRLGRRGPVGAWFRSRTDHGPLGLDRRAAR